MYIVLDIDLMDIEICEILTVKTLVIGVWDIAFERESSKMVV